MRKLMSATVAGLAVAGAAAAFAGAAQAQPYGYYQPAPGYYGNNGYNNGYYNQPYYNGYNRGYTQPYAGYGYNQPYAGGYGSNSGVSAGLSILGSVLGLGTGGYGYNGYGNVPVDQYGPDPNGMIAPDGHRIKCKLRRTYDNYYRQYVTRRECR